MATMQIQPGYFQTKAEAVTDIAETGYWPTFFVSKPSPELPVHHHAHDLISYVIEGETYMLDEHERRIPITAGDRLVLPAGAWHAEGAVLDTVTYLVSVREPIPLLRAITPLEARGPMPQLDIDRY